MADSEGTTLTERYREAQIQILSVLVMDLGYDHQPPHGHAPLRHQFAWAMAVGGRTDADIQEQITGCKDQNAREGVPFVPYYERADYEY
jgi:hypothetical protein